MFGFEVAAAERVHFCATADQGLALAGISGRQQPSVGTGMKRGSATRVSLSLVAIFITSASSRMYSGELCPSKFRSNRSSSLSAWGRIVHHRAQAPWRTAVHDT